MTEEWTASATFIAVEADGTRRSINVRVGVPRPASPEEWTCAVAIDGIVPRSAQIHGSDALQALGLGWVFVGRMLFALEDRGGHFELASGDPMPLSAYFPGLRDSSTGPSNER